VAGVSPAIDWFAADTAAAIGRDSDFASAPASFYDAPVLKLEVYAAGVCDLNKIRELDIEFGAIPAELRPKTRTQLLET
jgi:hypothetical protein